MLLCIQIILKVQQQKFHHHRNIIRKEEFREEFQREFKVVLASGRLRIYYQVFGQNFPFQEFPLWRNGIPGVLGALGDRLDPCASQWVEDLSLLPLCLGLQLLPRSDPWPGELHVPSALGQPNIAVEGRGRAVTFLLDQI